MVNTILTDDERPKLPASEYSLAFYDEGGVQTLDAAAYTEQDMEAYADAREAAVLAMLREQEPVKLDHIACIEDGELRYMTGRKAPAHDCELYAMPDGRNAPLLYAAPLPAVVPPGYKLVPVELLEKAAGAINWHLEPSSPDEHEQIWLELCALATAPEAPARADNWKQYAKDGETAQAVIERWRADCDALMSLMVKDRTTIRALREALVRCQSSLFIIFRQQGMTEDEARSMYAVRLAMDALAAPEAPARPSACRLTECEGRAMCPTCTVLAAPEAPALPADVREALKKAREALEDARRFIVNGVEFGYIRMPDPDTPDSAHQTEPNIAAALARIDALGGGE